MSLRLSKKSIATLALTLITTGAVEGVSAQVSVENAWIAATVAAQKSTAAFMILRSEREASLVGAASPAAGIAGVHQMSMKGTVMRMREVERVPLERGRAVTLDAAGTHIMLMDLKRQLKAGETVDLTLRFAALEKNGARKTWEETFSVPVRESAR